MFSGLFPRVSRTCQLLWPLGQTTLAAEESWGWEDSVKVKRVRSSLFLGHSRFYGDFISADSAKPNSADVVEQLEVRKDGMSPRCRIRL